MNLNTLRSDIDEHRREAADKYAARQRTERTQWRLTVCLSLTLAALVGTVLWFLATHFSR